MQVYDQLLPYVNGKGLAHASSVTFQSENSDVDILTLFLDFAGVTPSPLKVTVSVDSFDPVNGSILDELRTMERTRQVVKFALAKRGSGKKLEWEGYIRNVGGKSGVGEATTNAFAFVGADVA